MGVSPPPGTLLSEINAALNALHSGAALWRAKPRDLHGAVRLFDFGLIVRCLPKTCDHVRRVSAAFGYAADRRHRALAQTRVSKPSTASAPPLLIRCSSLKVAFATLDQLGFDRDVVAEPGRLAKTRARLHHRMADEIVGLEVVDLVHAQHPLEEGSGTGIENLEIARIENDPGRDRSRTIRCGSCGRCGALRQRDYRGAMRSAASSRTTTPLR